MTTVRDALNTLKWRDGALADAVVTYRHRAGDGSRRKRRGKTGSASAAPSHGGAGASGDVRVIRGEDVVDLHASFMEIRSREGTTMIPYHRVLLVEVAGRVAWRRHEGEGGAADAGVP